MDDLERRILNDEQLHEMMEEYFTFREEFDHLMQTEEIILTNNRIAFVQKQLIKLKYEIEREGGYIHFPPRPDY